MQSVKVVATLKTLIMLKRNLSFLLCLTFMIQAWVLGTPNESPYGERNVPATLHIGNDGKSLTLKYGNQEILKAHLPQKAKISSEETGEEAIEQSIRIKFEHTAQIKADIYGSEQSLAAETEGKAQKQFPLVRTSHGISNNLRNNAIYERAADWMLEMPEGTCIQAKKKPDGSIAYTTSLSGKDIKITFRPLYYQKHKNLAYYEPWNYEVYKGSVTGWSSW